MKHVAVKSLLSVMLSLIMVVVFTPAIAFADEPEAADEMLTAPPAIEDEFAGDILDSFEANEGVDPVKEASYEFNINSVSKIEDMMNNVKDSQAIFYKEDTNKNGYYCVKKVALKAGVLGLQAVMLAGTDQQTAKAKFALFYDKNCKKPVDGSMTIKEVDISAPRGSHSQSFFKIPKSQSYYVAVGATEKGWSSAESMWVSLRIYRFAKAKTGTTLKPGNVYGVRCGKGKTTTFNYKPKFTGAFELITDFPETIIEGLATNKVKTKLKTSSGKLLGAQASTKYLAVFGMKGNTKYKLSSTTDKKATDRGYMVFLYNDKVPNQSGVSKSKAKVLKQDVTKTSRIIAGSKKSQWFKFKLSEPGPVVVKYRGATNNKLKLQLYKGKTLLQTGYVKQSALFREQTLCEAEELAAGTYYIKVTPVKKSSGFYFLDYYAN